MVLLIKGSQWPKVVKVLSRRYKYVPEDWKLATLPEDEPPEYLIYLGEHASFGNKGHDVYFDNSSYCASKILNAGEDFLDIRSWA